MDRYYKIDFDAWYDTEERVLWMIDDPIAEREDAWNWWQIFDDHGAIITEYWWWGVWMPSWRHRCIGTEPQGLEVVEEGLTHTLDVGKLVQRINAPHHTTFYIYHRQEGTRGSQMRSLGDHRVPDLKSPRWDYFTPPPSSFRTRRVVSNRDDRSVSEVAKLRNPCLR